jgi:FkbM family methyltransferase
MQKTYIYGSGKYGVLTLLDLEQKGMKIAGFIDNNNELWGKTKLGYDIFPISKVLYNTTQHNIFIYISIADVQAVEQIYFELSDAGLIFLTHFDISPLISNSLAFSNKIPCVSIQRKPEIAAYPIFLRYPSTDLSTYKQVFEDFSYNFALNHEPQTIVDAGANIGLASVYFANKYPNAKIISVELEKNNFEMLKKNTANYKNIMPLHAALWNRNEKVCIVDTNKGNDAFQVGQKQSSEFQKINGFTIDKIMNMFELQKIDLLKIDIEGAEKEVFENTATWIGKINTMAIELHERLKPGCNRSFYKGTDGCFSYEKLIGETVWLWK